MADTESWGLGGSRTRPEEAQQEYWFSLRLRVDAPTQLWQAAALRCLSQTDLSQDEVEDLIGPIDDPSIADCLMMLALPERIPGCTRLNTALQPSALTHQATMALAEPSTAAD